MPLTIHCPACSKKLQIPDKLMGRMVRCPSCHKAFEAAESAGGQTEPEDSVSAGPGKDAGAGYSINPARTVSPKVVFDSDDVDDDEPVARKRRRRRGDGSAALAPAISLLCVAVLSLILSLIYGAFQLLVVAKNLPPPPPGMDEARKAGYEIGVRVGAYGFPIAFLLWTIFVLAGSIQMLRLRSYGLAITGAVVALLPCNPGCILGLPFGIWAIIVLAKPEVKEAFH
jgi:hypothetical protein